MKKTVIIILAILPIFLVITISFAARFLALYEYIDVEKVQFVNENNKEYEKNFIFTLNVGEEKQTRVRVLPDLANNKNVSYFSENNDICTVNELGVVTGVAFGTANIIVKTEEGGKTAMLLVKVTQKSVSGVSLPQDEVSLTVGDSLSLKATVEPYSATNKNVEYMSSDITIATVDANGKITAVKEGEAIITVRTRDGGYTDTCKVICLPGVKALDFVFPDNGDFIAGSGGYILNITEFNLLDYLVVDEARVDINDVKFDIQFGDKKATLSQDRLTITGKGIIIILAYVGELENPIYQVELKLMI